MLRLYIVSEMSIVNALAYIVNASAYQLYDTIRTLSVLNYNA
jgi:hypothetical protein